jgi:hypothetical protein
VHFLLGKVDYDFDGLVVGVHTRPADNVRFYFVIEKRERIKGGEELANPINPELDRPRRCIIVIDPQFTLPIGAGFEAARTDQIKRGLAQHEPGTL